MFSAEGPSAEELGQEWVCCVVIIEMVKRKKETGKVCPATVCSYPTYAVVNVGS